MVSGSAEQRGFSHYVLRCFCSSGEILNKRPCFSAEGLPCSLPPLAKHRLIPIRFVCKTTWRKGEITQMSDCLINMRSRLLNYLAPGMTIQFEM